MACTSTMHRGVKHIRNVLRRRDGPIVTQLTETLPQRWATERLRFTCIFKGGTPDSVENLWQSLSIEPETIVRGKQRPHVTKISTDLGALEFVLRSDRFDWNLSSSDQGKLTEWADLGEPRERLKRFIHLVAGGDRLSFEGDPSRLAVGVVAAWRAPTRETAFEVVQKLLPHYDLAGAYEAQVQINRPRDSKTIPGARINRVGKLHWGEFYRMRIVMTNAKNLIPEHEGTEGAQAAQAAVLLEVDANNVALDSGGIPVEKRRELLNEIVGVTEEFIEKGDVK